MAKTLRLTALALVVVLFAADALEAAKQRSWRGPFIYTEGTPPIPLDSFGFTPLLDKFYVYGGWDTNNGEEAF